MYVVTNAMSEWFKEAFKCVCMYVYFNEWRSGSIRVRYFDRLAACN